MAYTLTGADSGTLVTNGITALYTGIENLTGSSAADTFEVAGGSLSGTAAGAGGNDTLSGDVAYTVSGANSGSSAAIAVWTGIENLVGTAGDDTFTFNGGSLTGTADGLAGNDLFNITATGSALELVGGAGDDTWNLTRGVHDHHHGWQWQYITWYPDRDAPGGDRSRPAVVLA